MPAPRNRVLPLLLAIPVLVLAACAATERDEYVYIRSLHVAPTSVAEGDRLPVPMAARPFPDRMAALVNPGSLTDSEPISP